MIQKSCVLCRGAGIKRLLHTDTLVGDAVAQWLAHCTPDRAVRVQALAGVIVLCFWARHFTITVPLSTQEYKWVPATKCWLVTCDGLASHPGEVVILLVGFMPQKPG